MRALLVTRAGIGGAARHVLDVVAGLAGRHDIVVLASPLEDPAFLDRIAATGAEPVALPMERRPRPDLDVAALARVRAVIREGGFDVVHAHTAKAGAFVRVGRRAAPVVYSPHGFYHQYPDAAPAARRAALLTERLLAGRTDVLALCSEWEVRAAAADRIRPGREAVVIPNGVPVPEPLPPGERKAARAGLPAPGEGPVVLMAGRLKAPKDPLTFLAAAERRPDARFVLVGDGPLEGECRARAPANALLAGARGDLSRLLRAADVAVLATGFEAAPYFLLEAMAAGLPAVATDVPGTREVVGDAGVLVPPHDPAALAEAVGALVEDEAARADLGARARERVRAAYSPERMLEATERAWEKAR